MSKWCNVKKVTQTVSTWHAGELLALSGPDDRLEMSSLKAAARDLSFLSGVEVRESL